MDWKQYEKSVVCPEEPRIVPGAFFGFQGNLKRRFGIGPVSSGGGTDNIGAADVAVWRNSPFRWIVIHFFGEYLK